MPIFVKYCKSCSVNLPFYTYTSRRWLTVLHTDTEECQTLAITTSGPVANGKIQFPCLDIYQQSTHAKTTMADGNSSPASNTHGADHDAINNPLIPDAIPGAMPPSPKQVEMRQLELTFNGSAGESVTFKIKNTMNHERHSK